MITFRCGMQKGRRGGTVEENSTITLCLASLGTCRLSYTHESPAGKPTSQRGSPERRLQAHPHRTLGLVRAWEHLQNGPEVDATRGRVVTAAGLCSAGR